MRKEKGLRVSENEIVNFQKSYINFEIEIFIEY